MRSIAKAALKLREKIDSVVKIDATKNADGTTCLKESFHVFDKESVFAVMAAIGAGRPLLVRGVPGTGKTQLARAVAAVLEWEFDAKVVDAHTEVADLFFTFDAVERLAHAQIVGALRASGTVTSEMVRSGLDVMRFVRPGPLWRAFDPTGAETQTNVYRSRGIEAAKTEPARSGGDAAGVVLSAPAGDVAVEHPPEVERSEAPAVGNVSAAPEGEAGCARQPGHVVLIDEIDKADPSVPNGLLEALGQGTFGVLGRERVSLHREDRPAPLIMITTNEERELPSAFVRRCVVLELDLPQDEADLRTWLEVRGKAHFENRPVLSELKAATDAVIEDREKAKKRRLPPPGLAEYIDLLHALDSLEGAASLAEIRKAVFEKHLACDVMDGR